MHMKEFINKDTISYYARTNETLLSHPVKGILLEFPGLGGNSCLGGIDEIGTYDSDFAKDCAKKGILLAYIFTGPWSWMNEGSVRIADAVVNALNEKYKLNECPIVASGGSMGGLGALIYTYKSSHKITACCAACPCCDIFDSFDVIPDFPRTFISAVAGYKCETLSEALNSISPIHCIDRMPYVPYFIANCCADELFPEKQLDLYVKKMQEKGHNIEYVKMPKKLHGEFTQEGLEHLRAFQLKYFI